VAVPYRLAEAHIIFNPKFSVPLVSPCPVTMGLQEPAWWTEPQYYEWFDVRYMRLMLPIYIRKSAHLFPMSQFNLDETRKYIRFPAKNVTVTLPAPHAHLRPIEDRGVLEEFRTRFRLPARFILSVTRVDHPGVEDSTSFYPGKNPHTTLRAFIRCRDKIEHDLVFAGRRVREYLIHAGFGEADFDRVHFTGFVPLNEIAKLFNLAELVVIPSFYEGTSLTLMEAMACGCPVVASQGGACPETAGGAALLADPHDPSDFERKILQVLGDDALRKSLRAKSLARAAYFSWERTARLTLEGLERAARQ
jgi:glycosyltransferase involved in cell wall biosynthesis